VKLIKAFVRSRRIDEVVRALETARAPGITVSRVHGVGYGYEASQFTLAPNQVSRTPEVAKVEVVCCDPDADRLVDVVVVAARTGDRGDGIVFVTPVERAIRIRSSEENEKALCANGY
jgi:nitrogen regulatory protein P-II 1